MTRLSSPIRKVLDAPETERRVGPFQLVRQLGRGGSAPVWLAKEIYGGTELRQVAVKLFSLSGDRSTDASTGGRTVTGVRERIAREARALCRLEHDHIVRFFSIAVDEPAGVLAVAMEYLSGTSLDEALGQGEPLPLERTLQVGVTIASALSAVHEAGLLHRDVKPQNIIDSNGTYKLIDFGIALSDEDERAPRAALLDDLPLELTDDQKRELGALTFDEETSPSHSSVHTSGTFGYFDPACVAKRAAPSRASDLYALGVVLFECATGRHPATVSAALGGGLRTEILNGTERAPSLGAIASDLPSAFVRLVDAMLSPEPGERPRSAASVAIELERLLDDRAGRAQSLPPEGIGPFRGLGRFEAEDRGVYFGRSREIAAGLELLRGHGVVTLVGLSGSGKSSLARAGIAPRVTEGALGKWPAEWRMVTTSPGTDARASILSALGELTPPLALDPHIEPDDLVSVLGAWVEQHGRGLLVVVDQLEEIVTTSSASGRAFAMRLLQRIGEAPLPGVRALLAVRSDLLEALLRHGGEVGSMLVRGSLVVEPMSDASWGEVLESALEAYGYRLEDAALHDEVVGQLAETAGAMPLVAFALSELWQRRDREAKQISRKVFRELGGIAGALERHADAAVERLLAHGAATELEVRGLLLSLTTPRGTRASRPLREVLSESASYGPIAEELERARILVRGEEVTLAHEALLTHWGRLKRWVGEVRDDRVLAEDLDLEGRRYRDAPADVPLLKRRRLAAALEVQERGLVPLSALGKAYVDASRRAMRRGQWLVAAGSAFALGLVLLAAALYVGAARDREQAAIEKAALEQQRRADLEANQKELAARHAQITKLASDVASAKDENERLKLQAELDAARGASDATMARILPMPPPTAPRPPVVDEPAGSPAVQSTDEPKIKVQREDD
jgi:eukaryotic-like serine/threonine-protein kinase